MKKCFLGLIAVLFFAVPCQAQLFEGKFVRAAEDKLAEAKAARTTAAGLYLSSVNAYENAKAKSLAMEKAGTLNPEQAAVVADLIFLAKGDLLQANIALQRADLRILEAEDFLWAIYHLFPAPSEPTYQAEDVIAAANTSWDRSSAALNWLGPDIDEEGGGVAYLLGDVAGLLGQAELVMLAQLPPPPPK